MLDIARWRIDEEGLSAMTAARIAFGPLLLFFITVSAAEPNDAELMSLLKQRVDTQRWATGVVLGISSPGGRRIVAYGQVDSNDPRSVGGDTVFEIASLTKVFTSLLLADMAVRGELSLQAPVATCLRSKSRDLPARNGKQIAFIDLATHSSGLPLRPTNLASQTGANKYAGYTSTQLYQALGAFTLERDIGSSFEYSNWGYGLLGDALARCADTSYAALLHERITQPLGMSDTRLVPSAQMKSRAAVGHDEQFAPTTAGDFGALEGAGGLYSTANDLIKFIEAFLGRRQTTLGPAMATMLAETRPGDNPSTRIGLGWRISTDDDHQVVWSNGRSDGFRSFMGYDPQRRIGVVALANAATDVGVDDIGNYVLDSRQQPVHPHERIVLSAAVLERYIGQYRYEDGSVMSIIRDGDLVVGQWTEGSSLIFAESERVFNLDDVEAQLIFEEPVDGHAPGVTLHQNGKSFRAERVR
jgi:CubicO group peptidase (beta-lactamase class C family)